MKNALATIFCLLLSCAGATATRLPLTHVGHGRSPGPCIVDHLAIKPSAAYALRRLSCSIPFAVQIGRVSGGTQNIGFVGEALDTGAISAFCSGTTCNISIWYDQSGNSRNLVCNAGSVSTCAQIWASGPSATVGGRPAGLMNSTFNNWLTTNNGGSPDTGIIGTATGGILAVANAASGNSGTAGQGWFLVPALLAVIPSALNSSVAGLFMIQGGGTFSPPSFISNRYLGVGGGGTDISIPVSYTYGTDGVFAMRFAAADPTPNKTYLNGGTPQTNASVASNNVSADIQFGSIPSFPTPFKGNIAEGYVFAAEPSLADTNLLGNDIATWFGLTWTNITL